MSDRELRRLEVLQDLDRRRLTPAAALTADENAAFSLVRFLPVRNRCCRPLRGMSSVKTALPAEVK
jgi:hypothetical protein